MPDGDLSPTQKKQPSCNLQHSCPRHNASMKSNGIIFPSQDKYHTVPNQQSILSKLPGFFWKNHILNLVSPFQNKSGKYF